MNDNDCDEDGADGKRSTMNNELGGLWLYDVVWVELREWECE